MEYYKQYFDDIYLIKCSNKFWKTFSICYIRIIRKVLVFLWHPNIFVFEKQFDIEKVCFLHLEAQMFSKHYLSCLELLMTALRGSGCDIIPIRLGERCHSQILSTKPNGNDIESARTSNFDLKNRQY